jgi:AcrR family transcriptional regulator
MEPKERKIVDAAVRLFHRHGYRKVTMMDIAAEAGMSRPSLYASFANKEAIFAALMDDHSARQEAEAGEKVAGMTRLRDQLECLFEIWILKPFASVIDSENGADLLSNAANYAPAAAAALYARFEAQLRQVLEPAMAGDRDLTPGDLAHLLMMATKGLKAATATLAELRRLTGGLITLAVATAERPPAG